MESINRAFMYGESVFTTMLMKEGRIDDWEMHFERLKKGVEFVYGPFTDGEDWSRLLKNRLETRCFTNSGNKVVRLTVYRERARGLIKEGLISVMDLKINVSMTDFESSRVDRSVKLRTCPGRPRPHWWPSYLKAGSYLETILTQKMYLKETDDDLLFLSPQDTVWESSIANIFVVRHNKIYTAPAGPNVLEGIVRKKVMDNFHPFFNDCIEAETTIDQLYRADGVFGSNSVRGLFLVDRIDDRDLTPSKEFLQNFAALKASLYE